MRSSLIAFALMLCSFGVQATVIERPLPEPLQETQAQTLFHELKCMVCEGQSLADSDAKLAVQMRAKIRTMVSEGKSEADILTFFRESYGEKILMRPPLAMNTLLLWIAPAVLLLVGGVALWRATRGGGRG